MWGLDTLISGVRYPLVRGLGLDPPHVIVGRRKGRHAAVVVRVRRSAVASDQRDIDRQRVRVGLGERATAAGRGGFAKKREIEEWRDRDVLRRE